MMNIKVCTMFVVSCFAVQGFAQNSFYHDFDEESVGEFGVVDGLSIFGGSLLSRGVTADESVSSPNSAFFISSNLTAGAAFKWGLFSPPVTLDLSDPNLVLSVDVKALQASGVQHIAFQLADADGTTNRTANTDLFVVTTNFTTISQSPVDLKFEDGVDDGLDLENIVRYGLLYLLEDTVDENTFYIDNFRTVVELDTIDALTITNAPVIQFVGNAGVTYELESTMDINSNNWTSAGFSIEGTGMTQFMFDTTGSTNHKLYRVISAQ